MAVAGYSAGTVADDGHDPFNQAEKKIIKADS
jgi:hypothetical protein